MRRMDEKDSQAMATLLDLAHAEERRRNEQAAAIRDALKKGEFPTPEPVVRAIVWRVDRHAALRGHAYWQEYKLRAGLDALISAALVAHLDLARAEAALTAFAASRDSFEDHIRATVENPAQKEVMAFCGAYSGTVDTLRRFKERRSDIWDEITALRLAETSHIEFRFIYELRRNLTHGSVIVPYWNIRNDGTGSTGKIHFSAGELLAFGGWGADVKSFLTGQAEDSFSISAITSKCAQGLAKLRRELGILFARHRTDAERDFHAINDLGKRLSGRQMNKIVLSSLVGKGIDPYAHLHRFFSPEETRRILEYPPHSAEQVEYIIRLREAVSAVDDALRAQLYKLFSVPDEVEVVPEPPSIMPKALGEDWPPKGFAVKAKLLDGDTE